MSGKNQVRYNDKISKLRLAIATEKKTFIERVQADILKLLQSRSPVDIGKLKSSWRVTISNKHKLAGHSLSKLSEARPITLGISIESSSRHAPMQMFGWKQVPGQLLTGYKRGSKWLIRQASRPIFNVQSKTRQRISAAMKRGNKMRSFVTMSNKFHKPDPNLAFTGGSHSISAEIKRIVARRLAECKYLSRATFVAGDDVAGVTTRNRTRNRIAKWMEGSITTELNSRATRGLAGDKNGRE